MPFPAVGVNGRLSLHLRSVENVQEERGQDRNSHLVRMWFQHFHDCKGLKEDGGTGDGERGR